MLHCLELGVAQNKDEACVGFQIKPAWSASKANDALFAKADSCHLT